MSSRPRPRAVAARPEFEPRAGPQTGPPGGAVRRLGYLFDHLRANAPEGRVPANDLFRIVLTAPSRRSSDERSGTSGSTRGIRRPGPTDRLLALHKLFQWLTWSLVEPITEGGVAVTQTHALTGLAEYRSGGLLLDTGW